MSSTTDIPVSNVFVELLDEGDAIVRMMRNDKDWEPGTRSIWGGLVRQNHMVIDVGAYSGVYAIASALMGAKVIALEPHPANFQRLKANAALNSVRIEMIEAAASSGTNGDLLHMKRSPPSLCDTASLDGGEATCVSVRTVKLDDLKLSARVCLIKIDVEHSELRVLAGAIKTIKAHRPAIIVELLGEGERLAVDGFLGALGYYGDIVIDKRNHLYRHE